MNWLKRLLGRKDCTNVSSMQENQVIDNRVESDFSTVERTGTEATAANTLEEKHDEKMRFRSKRQIIRSIQILLTA